MKANLTTASEIVTLFHHGDRVGMTYNRTAHGGRNDNRALILLSKDCIQRGSKFSDGAQGRAYINTSVQDYPPNDGESGTKGTLTAIIGDYLEFTNLEDYVGKTRIRDAKTAKECYRYEGSKHQFKIGANYFISHNTSIKVMK